MVYLFIYLCIYLFIYVFIYLCIIYLFIYLFIYIDKRYLKVKLEIFTWVCDEEVFSFA